MYGKIIGSILLFGAAAGIGKWKAEFLRLRIRRLEAFRRMLLLLQGELRFHRAALSEAFENAAVRIETPYDTFLEEIAEKLKKREEGFHKIWDCASKMLFEKGGFEQKDQQLFELLGNSFGYLDLEMQMSSLELVRNQTEEALADAKEMEKERGKLYQTMGVTVGALLVLLII